MKAVYYFDAKADLFFINLFKREIDCFNHATIFKNELLNSYYLDEKDRKKLSEADNIIDTCREKIAKKTIRAIEISDKYGVSTSILSIPPPIIGGPMIPVNIYEAVLNDNSYGRKMNSQLIMDAINKTIGQIEVQKKKDIINIFNPMFWIKLLFVKIIRIPFVILSMSGFNIEKIENHLISKLFKFFEVAFIILMLLRFGFDESKIKDAFISLITK